MPIVDHYDASEAHELAGPEDDLAAKTQIVNESFFDRFLDGCPHSNSNYDVFEQISKSLSGQAVTEFFTKI